MRNDFEIGRVVAVDTAQVTMQLNEDLKAMTRTTYERAYEIGRINSYVIIPVGAHRLVAMITRVVLTEEAEVRADRTMVTLPSAKRIMKAVLVGTIDGKEFTQGVTTFPILDNPVHLPSDGDLQIIFNTKCEGEKCEKEDAGRKSGAKADADEDERGPGFCIELGDSPLFDGFTIKINPDAFFGKHAAVLGSTGSGKSCTIASIIQSVIAHEGVKRTHFVILDTNGEYRKAFQRCDEEEGWVDAGDFGSLYIPSDPTQGADRLVMPYWFMNAEDFVRLFRASGGLQEPVLLQALRLARSEAGDQGLPNVIDVLRTSCSQIIAHAENDAPNQMYYRARNVQEYCDGSLRYEAEFPSYVAALDRIAGPGTWRLYARAVSAVKATAQAAPGSKFDAVCLQKVHDSLDPVIALLNQTMAAMPNLEAIVSPDHPSYFCRSKLLEHFLQMAMREQTQASAPGRVREACGPMLLRIRRFYEDPRFHFLFQQLPGGINHVLAAFIRDMLGLPSPEPDDAQFADEGALFEEVMPFYDRQRGGAGAHNVVIVDLSLLASEVLENVTALIGRLILEFLQRLGEDGRERGELPVVLVLEEAQNYIPETRFGQEDSVSKLVFERIAREGRKHGLGLVIASQRPSELSKTVLSQCSSFIVHRLQNPEDLRYFKEIVPGMYGPMLDQLPALAPRTAIVLGECVRAPALVRIREAEPTPRSRDPEFFKYWTNPDAKDVPVEKVCAKWEGKPSKPTQADTAPPADPR